MQKKNGFTLVEIIVVIAISAIVLTMVGTTMVFMTNVSGNLLEEAEDIDMAKNIEKYLRGLLSDETRDSQVKPNMLIAEGNNQEIIQNDVFVVNISEGTIKEIVNQRVVFSDTGLVSFYIVSNDGFVKCHMEFNSGKKFDFILGIAEEEE